jgi:hypothetical protein
VNSPTTSAAAATAVTGALGKGLLTCNWSDLPAPSVVAAIHTLLLQQRSAAASATDTAGASQSPQAKIEELHKGMLARASELTVPVVLASLQALIKSSNSMHNTTAAAAAVISALAQGLVATDWRSYPAASVVAAINTLLSLHQRASTTTAGAGATDPQPVPQVLTEDMQKALLTRIDELAPPVLLEALQTMLSSSSSGSSSSGGSATVAAAAVIGALVNKLVASDWRTLPVASAKAAIMTLLTLLQQWSTPSDSTRAAYRIDSEEVQRALLARVGELPAQVVLESLQALLNSNGGSSSSSSGHIYACSSCSDQCAS